MDTTQKKIILFGCSFSYDLKESGFDLVEHNYNIIDKFTYGGNSNQRIVEDVYNYINSDEYTDTDILNIQWSYNNRLWVPSNLIDSHFSFHGLQDGLIFNSNEGYAKYLRKFYQLFIGLFYDNELFFKEQLKQIDLLRTYMDSKNIKYFQYLHSVNSHFHETSINDGKKVGYSDLDIRRRNSKPLNDVKDEYYGWKNIAPMIKNGNKVKLEDYNLQSIEGSRCLAEWVTKNRYETSYPTNIHLSEEGQTALATFLLKKYNLINH